MSSTLGVVAFRLPFTLGVLIVVLVAALLGPIGTPVAAQTANLPDPTLSEQTLKLEIAAVLPANAGRRMMEFTHAGDGSGRGFVPVQEGQIWVVNPDGSVPPSPMLDLTTAPATANRFIRGCCAFGGLTYIAFHPDFETPGALGFGKVYTAHQEVPNGTPNYRLSEVTQLDPIHDQLHHHVIAEWRVLDPTGAGRNTIDGSSYREVYRVEYQDEFANPHAIGEITFNPFAQPGSSDYGNLYASVSDGGNGASLVHAPWAQDLSNPFGSIIRINPTGGGQFTIPADNPFINVAGAAKETYVYGLRDPQTLSFGQNPDGSVELIIADIGFNEVEEIDLARGGENFGWDSREGTLPVRPDPTKPQTPIDTNGPLTNPVAQYDHRIPSNQQTTRALPTDGPTAIIGGFVYTGVNAPDLRGEYMFGDLVRGRFFHVSLADMVNARRLGTQAPIRELLVEVDGQETVFIDLVNPGGQRADVRFGQGENGEVYVLNKWDRTIRRVAPTAPTTPPVMCFGQPVTILGTEGNDTLTGTNGPDVIAGLGGDDTIDGMGDNDLICGGPGDDRITGGEGWDSLFGDDGNDIIDAGLGNDLVDGGPGNDTLRGGDGNDSIEGQAGRDRLFGDDGNDKLFGGHGNDRLVGGAGKDTLRGKQGNDKLFGNSGDDTLRGGPGDDRIRGGSGKDAILGGPGNDYCNGGASRDTATRCKTKVKI